VRFIEVSHRVVPGMKTYPGLAAPKVDVIVDYESSRERYGGKAEFLEWIAWWDAQDVLDDEERDRRARTTLRRATGYWVPGVFNVVQCVPPSIVRCSEPRTVA
jgi:hypothetical protein